MSAGISAAFSWALPLANCFVRSVNAPRASQSEIGIARAPHEPKHGLRTLLHAAWRRHRTRQYLVGMNAYLLKDIGVSFAEAEAEANKPFWIA